ncbi:MAG: hydrolase [Rhodomicrobium sp.]|nr:hydrolase [Rhodomicrobium sp.]
MLLMKRKMSQLLIVDLQDKVFAPIPERKKITDAAVKLIKAAKSLEIPITVSEQYPKGLGPTTEAVRAEIGNSAAVFDKVHFSCMRNDRIRLHLEENRDAGCGQMIISGIEAHVCVTQTALASIAEGYEVFVVADGVGSRSQASRDLGLKRLRQAGAVIVDSEMVIFEWLEQAATPEFKALQPLIK